MLVWLFALVTVLLVTPLLFALAHMAKRLSRQQRQGFARRAAPDTTAVDIPAPLTRKKPDWVVREVLRLKALMGRLTLRKHHPNQPSSFRHWTVYWWAITSEDDDPNFLLFLVI